MRLTSKRVEDLLDRLLDKSAEFRTGDFAAAAGVSRQAAHRRLAGLLRTGALARSGKGPAARYRRGDRSGARFVYGRRGLDEDLVWRDSVGRVPFLRTLADNSGRILRYAFTEMLNNAIDHSGSGKVEVLFPPPGKVLAFEVIDRGVGIFDHVRRRLRLASRLEAIGEISKGKTTTQPEKHTGEGIFFVSKIADRFEIESADLRWIVDNAREDVAVGSVDPPRKGTRVRFEVRPGRRRTLKQLFDEYTEDFEFTKTRVVVKLFAIGVSFVSRSEAKRLLSGLEKFTEVVLDFHGVQDVGQGFADEVFRVWARAHRGVRLTPVHMAPAVEFMVRRAAR